MSSGTDTPGEYPQSLSQRLSHEWLKIAAAILAFAIIGTVLVLVLRGDDGKHSSAPGGNVPAASPTALASPTSDASATVAAAQQHLTATADTRTANSHMTYTAVASLSLPGSVVTAIPVSQEPGPLAATADAIWVSMGASGTVTRRTSRRVRLTSRRW